MTCRKARVVVLQVSNADKFVAERLACSGCQLERAVDELNQSKKIISWHPSSLPLPDHVDSFVALNRSPGRLKFSEALLRIHSTFDGSMILFENVVQVLHRSVSTAVAQRPFLLTVGDRASVNRCQVSVGHSRLGMGSIAKRLAKQPLGSIGITKRRQQEIDGGHPRNRWRDTSSTSGPSRGRRFRRLVKTCWLA